MAVVLLPQNNIKTDVSSSIGNSRHLELCSLLFAVRVDVVENFRKLISCCGAWRVLLCLLFTLLLFVMFATASVLRTIRNRAVSIIFRCSQSTQLKLENDIAADKQIYPLEGIRVLDLTRIGDLAIWPRAFCDTFSIFSLFIHCL